MVFSSGFSQVRQIFSDVLSFVGTLNNIYSQNENIISREFLTAVTKARSSRVSTFPCTSLQFLEASLSEISGFSFKRASF